METTLPNGEKKSPILYVGADVSKSQIDFYYEVSGKGYHAICANEVSVLCEYLVGLAGLLSGRQVHIVLEATGTYSEFLVHSLHQSGLSFSVISPSKSRAFMQSENLSSINDKQAAKYLMRFGQQKQPAAYEMPSENNTQLKRLIRATDQLKSQLQVIHNQMHARDYEVGEVEQITQTWQELETLLEQKIAQFEQEIQNLCSKDYSTMIDNLSSIKGVGPTTAQAFVILTQGFQLFESAKQLAKFVGICPTQADSGSSVRKPKHILKGGVQILKSLLFNCARAALRSDNVFKRYFDTLKERGKNGKVALTAVMHKILRVIFAIAKKQTNFDLNFANN